MAKLKSVKRGACAFTVIGRRAGEILYDEEMVFPVSWRGRDAASRSVKRKKYQHAVLALTCGGRSLRRNHITLVSCEKGKCEVLGGQSNRRQENKHRGKARYNNPIAGLRRGGR